MCVRAPDSAAASSSISTATALTLRRVNSWTCSRPGAFPSPSQLQPVSGQGGSATDAAGSVPSRPATQPAPAARDAAGRTASELLCSCDAQDVAAPALERVLDANSCLHAAAKSWRRGVRTCLEGRTLRALTVRPDVPGWPRRCGLAALCCVPAATCSGHASGTRCCTPFGRVTICWVLHDAT